eukprot:CAMPEP_0185028450 /NCGR_PEP_ID=MMETSP1103-20130426/14168_1 /TAXON_ID=36769 /ORGANISM="Paraphysomonas bandaiensis, Strain Caron Lab Isolate" /LENGTH=652 /DNA_ID=CAMNT_0027562875 /DNA_START=12 /DNA_END=1970 /DNA_ORIENTATION=+
MEDLSNQPSSPPTSPTISPSPPDESSITKDEKREKKRVLVIKEIISSETTYFNRLQTTVDVFMIPFREKGILSNTEYDGQFGQLEMIRDMHKKLLSELNEAEGNGVNSIRVGKVFKDFSYFLKMYKQYLACFEGAIVRRAKLLTSNKKFADFLEKARSDPRCKGLTLDSLLIEPVQRVPRYRLLLEELLKYTPETNEDHQDIVEALENVRDVAAKNNEAIRQQEGMDKVYQVMIQLDSRYSVNLLDKPSRMFVRQGDLMKQCRRGRKEFRFWVFSDKLLYGESTGLGTYRPSRDILLTQLRVTAVDENGEFAMRIESPAKSFYVWFTNSSERDSWVQEVSRLRQAMLEEAVRAGEDTAEEIVVAPVWNPDKAASCCEVCNTSFTLFNRKHHCRSCGVVVCDGCSRSKVLLPHVDAVKPQRVCDTCNRKMLSAGKSTVRQPRATAEISFDGMYNKAYTSSTSPILKPESPSTGGEFFPNPAYNRLSSAPTNFVPPTKKPSEPLPARPDMSLESPEQLQPRASSMEAGQLYAGDESDHSDNEESTPLCGEDESPATTPPHAPVPQKSAPALSAEKSNPLCPDLPNTSLFSLVELQELVRERSASLLERHGIDVTCKESALLDEDFVNTFGCSKDEFKKWPKWKQIAKRKENGLF